jgi:hypothetical protein
MLFGVGAVSLNIRVGDVVLGAPKLRSTGHYLL